jgi:hypothetical protein
MTDAARETHRLVNEARAYLAQAELEVPTDKELLELMPETMRDEFSYAAQVYSDATGGQVRARYFPRSVEHCCAGIRPSHSRPLG